MMVSSVVSVDTRCGMKNKKVLKELESDHCLLAVGILVIVLLQLVTLIAVAQ